MQIDLDGLLARLAVKLPGIDAVELTAKVKKGYAPGEVRDLLILAAETAASLVSHHPNWAILAGRVLCEEIYLRTPPTFSGFVKQLHSEHPEMLNPELVAFVASNSTAIDGEIREDRDAEFTFFAVRTLEHAYLMPFERPQYLWMRVALAIHFPDLPRVFETYDLCSRRVFTHATPTLFNAGRKGADGQLASCFLMGMRGPSISDMFETLRECAIISHHVGGIGLHCSNIPAHSSSSGDGGLVPLLRVFNNAARFVSQGNKRPGAISITIEPWHADVLAVLDLKKNHGKEEYRARDLFYALWMPDLFMEKVKNDAEWYLFSPDTAPGLSDVCGVAFVELYERYVREKRYTSNLPARTIWERILTAQIETGGPSLLYKDSSNAKSNQQNLGVIKSSNLCTEIIQYSDGGEIAVCNLASIALQSFVMTGSKKYDFKSLHATVKVVVRNLNSVIDRGSYPLPACRTSNSAHRPLAVGVQGLADTYFKMRLNFDSQEANELNARIFETIYHAALDASCELAEINGAYPSYKDSPMCREGKLQFDFWSESNTPITTTNLDWATLRKRIVQFGVYNSLLTGVMPTATTAQILGSTESVEPITSNLFSRGTISGDFQLINQYLVAELEERGVWSEYLRQEIVAFRGSVQRVSGVPEDIRMRYKTAYELSMRSVIEQSVARAPYIDQTQSMNLFLPQPTPAQLTSMHFHAWQRGLKTGIYYLRTQPAAHPIPFTVSHESRLASEGPNSKRRKVSHPVDCEVCTS